MHIVAVLQKLDNIRQRASREGKHKGDENYIKDVKTGPLKDMPLTVRVALILTPCLSSFVFAAFA